MDRNPTRGAIMANDHTRGGWLLDVETHALILAGRARGCKVDLCQPRFRQPHDVQSTARLCEPPISREKVYRVYDW